MTILQIAALCVAISGGALLVDTVLVAIGPNEDCRSSTQVDADGNIACGIISCESPLISCDQDEFVTTDGTVIKYCNCGNIVDPFEEENFLCHAYARKPQFGIWQRACMPHESCEEGEFCKPEDATLAWQRCECKT